MANKDISMKKAVMFNMISKYSVVIIQLVYNAIMARILLPSEFGVVSILTVFTNFFGMLADFGIGNAIIQRQNIKTEDINTSFVFAIGIGFTLEIVFSLCAYPISWVYSNSEYIRMVPILSIAILFNTMSNIPAALLSKAKKFKTIAIRQITINVLASIWAVFLAMNGWSYYSLVFYTLITAIANFLWNFFFCGHRFRIEFHKESLKKIGSFSVNLMLYNITNYAGKSVDRLIIGRTKGDSDVGNYSKSVQLTTYPINYLALAITPTILPYMAAHQNDKTYIYNKYLQLTKFLSILGVFVAVVCCFTSQEIITILYGNNWIDTIKCFRWNAFSIWPMMLVGANSSIYQVLGKTKELFRVSVLTLIFSITAAIVGSIVGELQAVAILMMLVQYVNWFVMVYQIAHILDVPFLSIAKGYTFELVSTIVIGIILSLLVLVMFGLW